MSPAAGWRFFASARGRLLALVLLVIVPVQAVQVFSAWRDLRQTMATRQQESLRTLIQAAGDFDELLADTRTVFSDLVQAGEMRNPTHCTQVFTALRFAYERLAPDATNLVLASGDGDIYCAINPMQGPRNIAGRPEFQAAVQSTDRATGAYSLDPSSGSPVINVAYPVLSFDGAVQAVIVASFGAHWLENWQQRNVLPAGGAITLLSPDGGILWRTVDGHRQPLPGQSLQGSASDATPALWLEALQAGNAVFAGPDLDGIRRLHALAPLKESDQIAGYLQLGYPVAQLYSQAYADLSWKLGLLAVVLVAALTLAWWSSKRLFLGPLQDLMSAVERVQAGDLSARASTVHGLSELTALGESFDRMADTLQQRELERMQMAERFRAAFESSAIGMSLMTLDGRVLAANAAVCQMSGYTEGELLQRNDNQNVYPPDAQVGMDKFAEMLAGQRGYYSVERRYLRRSGEVFWTRLTLSLVRDAAGQPAYLIGMVENIDDQKRNSAALAESEARFRAMFENAAVGITLVAPDGRALAVNPVLARLSGYSEAELMAVGGQQLTFPEDRDIGRIELHEILEGKRETFQVEKRYVTKDGRIHWMRHSVSAVRDSTGQVLYLITIAEDVDERRKTLQELSESEARFKAVFDNSAVGVAIMTLDRHIVQINPTVTRITGYSPEEMFQKNPSDMIVEEDRTIDRELFLEMVAGRRDQYLIEKRYIRRDGSLFWGRINFALVRNADGQPLYIIGMIEDITEEKGSAERLAAQEAEYRGLLEQRIAERTEELNRANELLRAKAALDAVAVERTRLARELHDAVTQTLFSTALIAEVLPALWEMNPAEGQRRLAELRELTRGALAEMRTLLMELRPHALVEASLPTLLRQLTEAMIGRARIAIELSAEGERKLPPDVQVGLYRIAQEALNNVVKHAHATQAVVTLRLGEIVRLGIADNGAGFDPGSVSADHLGLRIMRERAEAIGARLSVQSEPHEGTHVTVVWTDNP